MEEEETESEGEGREGWSTFSIRSDGNARASRSNARCILMLASYLCEEQHCWRFLPRKTRALAAISTILRMDDS